MLLISVLPAIWRSPLVVCTCAFLDLFVFVEPVTWAVCCYFTNIAFVVTQMDGTEAAIECLEGIKKRSRVGDAELLEGLQASHGHFRRLQIQLEFYNLVASSGLWLTKIMFMTWGVLGGFSAIRLAHTNPPLVFLYGLTFCEGVVLCQCPGTRLPGQGKGRGISECDRHVGSAVADGLSRPQRAAVAGR